MAEKNRVYIIAEAGVNHNGNEEKALALINIAAEAGANAVKFQLFSPHALVTETAPTADYQARNLKNSRISQRDMLKALTLPRDTYPRLARHCRQRRIDFICTPFDEESLAYLVAHTKMPYLKLPSGEITNGPLLLAAARTGLPIILSTGMSDLKEIGQALSVLQFGYRRARGYPKAPQRRASKASLKPLRHKVTLLHCVSQYPAPVEATNLRAVDTMRTAFGLPVGLSDHSEGIAIAIAAAARGATMIEKHFTYDKNAPGPDHKASLLPQELAAMIAGIREVEKALGDGKKHCQPQEESTRRIARKSLVTACDIKKGEKFTPANLTAKRPATGRLAPNCQWELLGKKARRDYAADEFIDAKEMK